ncbi:dTDP-4-dehydrorhamnose 3,5-epimerase [Striga asiatica]|uniref:dTDP-4-dehydrorhamnose 3,5-epimerase n=1 Tax=Striga asiatica TaxID=4170 RepID=A0A5A7RHR4_STRAF|nr:dTDP-4-dehydrorhamnose 3,5-epimerase [Striga asiatica]
MNTEKAAAACQTMRLSDWSGMAAITVLIPAATTTPTASAFQSRRLSPKSRSLTHQARLARHKTMGKTDTVTILAVSSSFHGKYAAHMAADRAQTAAKAKFRAILNLVVAALLVFSMMTISL